MEDILGISKEDKYFNFVGAGAGLNALIAINRGDRAIIESLTRPLLPITRLACPHFPTNSIITCARSIAGERLIVHNLCTQLFEPVAAAEMGVHSGVGTDMAKLFYFLLAEVGFC